MLALTIALTWLTLAGGGFAALSALDRRGRRQELDTERCSLLEPQSSILAYTWPGLWGAGSR